MSERDNKPLTIEEANQRAEEFVKRMKEEGVVFNDDGEGMIRILLNGPDSVLNVIGRGLERKK